LRPQSRYRGRQAPPIKKVTFLHQAGYVHGDVHDTNIMVKDRSQGFKLVDFDWSGRIGKV
jgi:tRNA A-37 threonylcarbamoyl transferase component Bud32